MERLAPARLDQACSDRRLEGRERPRLPPLGQLAIKASGTHMAIAQAAAHIKQPLESPFTLGDFDDFLEVCGQQRVYIEMGILDRIIAVDNMQYLAELWGLTDADQDLVQQIMAAAFGGLV